MAGERNHYCAGVVGIGTLVLAAVGAGLSCAGNDPAGTPFAIALVVGGAAGAGAGAAAAARISGFTTSLVAGFAVSGLTTAVATAFATPLAFGLLLSAR